MVQALMRKHLQRDADITWIASKLDRAHLDKDFARRFTFDADLVEEYSLHDANPSWRVLEDIVEGRAVDNALRDSLASKVTGLLGERAAMARVRSSGFTEKYFPMRGDADLAGGLATTHATCWHPLIWVERVEARGAKRRSGAIPKSA